MKAVATPQSSPDSSLPGIRPPPPLSFGQHEITVWLHQQSTRATSPKVAVLYLSAPSSSSSFSVRDKQLQQSKAKQKKGSAAASQPQREPALPAALGCFLPSFSGQDLASQAWFAGRLCRQLSAASVSSAAWLSVLLQGCTSLGCASSSSSSPSSSSPPLSATVRRAPTSAPRSQAAGRETPARLWGTPVSTLSSGRGVEGGHGEQLRLPHAPGTRAESCCARLLSLKESRGGHGDHGR